jgi:hypothetical protein
VLLAGLSLLRIASRPSCKYDSASGLTQSLQDLRRSSKNARLWDGRLEHPNQKKILELPKPGSRIFLVSIHVATAILANAECFITNDQKLSRVQEIKVLTIEDL